VALEEPSEELSTNHNLLKGITRAQAIALALIAFLPICLFIALLAINPRYEINILNTSQGGVAFLIIVIAIELLGSIAAFASLGLINALSRIREYSDTLRGILAGAVILIFSLFCMLPFLVYVILGPALFLLIGGAIP
jgi:hypothetical protein